MVKAGGIVVGVSFTFDPNFICPVSCDIIDCIYNALASDHMQTLTGNSVKSTEKVDCSQYIISVLVKADHCRTSCSITPKIVSE